MIAVRFMGGLGNQLFQYAFGRAKAIERKDVLYFFSTGDERGDRPIDILKMVNSIKLLDSPRLSEIYRFKPGSISFRIERRLLRVLPHFSDRLYIEKGLGYEAPGRDYSFFDGYWQSFRYFQDYFEQIAGDIVPETDIDFNHNNVGLVNESDSVSIHIRRGDYKLAGKRSPHFCLDEFYYRASIDKICEITDNPNLIVFSDDPGWVKDNYRFLANYKTSFASSDEDSSAVSDLLHMSQCSHNIIANSSFSWWGAYLNRNPDKIVIAPSKWYRDWVKYNIDDILPPSWIRIPL